MIQVKCGDCGSQFRANDGAAGGSVQCPKCRATIWIAAPAPPPPIVPPQPVHPQPSYPPPQPQPHHAYYHPRKSGFSLGGLVTGCLAVIGLGTTLVVVLFVATAVRIASTPRQAEAPAPALTTTPAPAERPRPPRLDVGDMARLATGASHGRVFLSAGDDRNNWDAMIDAENQGGISGIAQLIREGKVFGVQTGTTARILDTSPAAFKVRIVHESRRGVESEEGREGWVQRELVGPF